MLDDTPTAPRLDQIDTRWSLLRLAHEPGGAAGPARNALALRYRQAIRSYIGAQVHDEQDADDLAQEVLVSLVRGDFAQADPQRGRFRDFLKGVVRNRIRSFWTRQSRRGCLELTDENAPAVGPSESAADAEWDARWRQSLLRLAWAALEDYERTAPGSVAHALLKLRVDFPEDDSPRLAERLAEATGRQLRPEALRQQLRRARLRFAQLLVEEVARGLDRPTPDAVEEELRDVGLMEYVRDFLPADWRDTGELVEGKD